MSWAEVKDCSRKLWRTRSTPNSWRPQAISTSPFDTKTIEDPGGATDT